MSEDQLTQLVGKEFNFYGVDMNEFRLDGTVYEAKEARPDGYRSYLGSIKKVESDGIFSRTPLARVRVNAVTLEPKSQIEEEWNIPQAFLFEGYMLVDVNTQHVWLLIGTENYQGYYPVFTFHYQTPEAPIGPL